MSYQKQFELFASLPDTPLHYVTTVFSIDDVKNAIEKMIVTSFETNVFVNILIQTTDAK